MFVYMYFYHRRIPGIIGGRFSRRVRDGSSRPSYDRTLLCMPFYSLRKAVSGELASASIVTACVPSPAS